MPPSGCGRPGLPTLLHLHPEDARARRELLAREGAWLRERGIVLLLADERVESSDRELYGEVLELPPPAEVAATLAALRELARRRPLDGVLLQSEWALPAGALLARELGLPGPPPEAALRCLGKHLTRAALAEARVPQPEFALARSAGDVRRFADAHGFPLVLKALASTMARLVTRVDGAGGIEGAVARLRAALPQASDVARFAAFARAARLDPGADASESFLCETLAPGDPVEADGLAAGGPPRAFGVLEQVMTDWPRLYIEAYLLPADRPGAEAAVIGEAAERAVAAVGLDCAGFSVELRAAAGAARVIEVNGRLGEDDGLHRLYQLSCGAHPFRLAVELALGGRPDFERRETGHHALAYRCAFEAGFVGALPGAAELAALKAQAVDAGLCVRAGDRLHAPPHPDTAPHLAWAIARHAASSRAALEVARERLRRLHFTLVQSRPP